MWIYKLREKFYFLIKKYYWHKAYLKEHSFIEISAKISNVKNVYLGSNSYISHCVVITNDFGRIVLGNKSHIAPNCVVNCYKANLIIGNNVAIGPNCSIIAHSNKYEPNKLITNCSISADVIIGNNVFIGANSVILPGVCIGDNSVVGAGAVLTKTIPNNVVVTGIPAKIIKIREFS